jgi:FkbM family methyltransferase
MLRVIWIVLFAMFLISTDSLALNLMPLMNGKSGSQGVYNYNRAVYNNHTWLGNNPQWFYKYEMGVLKAFDAILNNPKQQQQQPKCNVVDVGTNRGFYTLMSASYGCNVYGFEIQKDCIDYLINGVLKSANGINVNNIENKIKIYQNPVSSISHTIKIKYKANKKCDGNYGFTREDCPQCDYHGPSFSHVEFNTTTLDIAFLHGSKVQGELAMSVPIDIATDTTNPNTTKNSHDTYIKLLKIDTEGHDLDVLQGSMSLLKYNLIENMIVEIVPSMWPINNKKQHHHHRHQAYQSHFQSDSDSDSETTTTTGRATKIFTKILSYNYSAVCLTPKDVPNSNTNTITNFNANTKYDKMSTNAFLKHLLSERCVDWHFKKTTDTENVS